jgi:DNA polymerase-1
VAATFSPGECVALAFHPDTGAAVVGEHGSSARWSGDEATDEIARLEREVGPRWTWWGPDTARALVAAGVRPARCWDLDAVHRLLHGGWRSGPGRVWAAAHGLDAAGIPTIAPVDLFHLAPTDDEQVVRPDGHLDPGWIDAGWHADVGRLTRWAELALEVREAQATALAGLERRPAAPATARSESAASLLCAELEYDGLPIDVPTAETIIAAFIGPRPTDAADEARLAAARDELVLRHVPVGDIDLRNPANVKSLLRRAGIEVPDTRAWRLEQLRDRHPIVDALLAWRKAERIATTFGYRWLDEHVGADGRLRGRWSSSDGAAGRMTATAGLHNLPAELRPAVAAEEGHVFVRADLGQIEPRILAAVSGDEALIAATVDDDMYAPVAARLGVTREIAKVAVLGAMYGQTTGQGAVALRGLESAYPTAMGYLDDAARRAEGGNDLRTRGGRRVRMSASTDPGDDDGPGREERSRAAARGRYGRNAMIQGAAAEFFKTWAVIVRARAATHGARIVLCLHDELLVHAPADAADAVREIVDDGVQEARYRWSPGAGVRFVADTSVVARWSDAK